MTLKEKILVGMISVINLGLFVLLLYKQKIIMNNIIYIIYLGSVSLVMLSNFKRGNKIMGVSFLISLVLVSIHFII